MLSGLSQKRVTPDSRRRVTFCHRCVSLAFHARAHAPHAGSHNRLTPWVSPCFALSFRRWPSSPLTSSFSAAPCCWRSRAEAPRVRPTAVEPASAGVPPSSFAAFAPTHADRTALIAAACENCQLACKPGSVWRLPSATAIPLGRGSLRTSSNQPGRRPGSGLSTGLPRRPCRPYSVLLPVGFAVPLPLPTARCALTAPFHPCLDGLPRAGGLFSVALSLGSPPAAVSRHRQSLEPGLSSTARFWPQSLPARQRPSGQLAGRIRGGCSPGSRAEGRVAAPSWPGWGGNRLSYFGLRGTSSLSTASSSSGSAFTVFQIITGDISS